MIQNIIAHPEVVGRDEWLTARKTLLEHEKELTKQRDRINAERRRLPMVKLDKEYTFEGSNGSAKLINLFEGRTQLIIYHFMFAPEWEKGCMGCTGFVYSLGNLSMLNERDTTFALVSRAPLPKLEAYKQQKGWTLPWYSSFGSDFNYDFHVTLDETIAPIEYNYRDKAELEGLYGHSVEGESHGLSVFFRMGDDVFHTYSTYARGVESLTNSYSLLDVTPYGRQEDFEDSPPGYPQKPTYG
ncbi:DUF899 domain-containing protein [Pantanalinema rosaneae CENA516]|uniref:DUF899 domain-containing protein n=1 Tax=Pantanalinema rosaneae TaxID=1620701 RepID=UPI003D6FFFBD